MGNLQKVQKPTESMMFMYCPMLFVFQQATFWVLFSCMRNQSQRTLQVSATLASRCFVCNRSQYCTKSKHLLYILCLVFFVNIFDTPGKPRKICQIQTAQWEIQLFIPFFFFLSLKKKSNESVLSVTKKKQDLSIFYFLFYLNFIGKKPQ